MSKYDTLHNLQYFRWYVIITVSLHLCNVVTGYTDYSAAFYTYDALLLISAITVAVMPLGAKLPADNLLHDLVNIIKMPHIIIFIFFLFALGNFWGFIESYLFLYLKELGAPNFLLGKYILIIGMFLALYYQLFSCDSILFSPN